MEGYGASVSGPPGVTFFLNEVSVTVGYLDT